MIMLRELLPALVLALLLAAVLYFNTETINESHFKSFDDLATISLEK